MLEQSVRAGKEVRRGSRIALAVGGGPRFTRAPRLIGLTPAKAQKRLEESGLRLGERKEVPSEGVSAGEVVAQDPSAGKGTKRGTKVDLTFSAGPPKRRNADRGGVPPVGGSTGWRGGPPMEGNTAGNQYR